MYIYIREYCTLALCLVAHSSGHTGRVDAVARVAFTASASIGRCCRWYRGGQTRKHHRRNASKGLLLSSKVDGDVEGVGGDNGGGYFDTQDLLNDPSVVERVLARTRETVPPVPVMDGSIFRRTMGHHCAIRTADIIRAMKFYSLLGLNEVVRFKAENARCVFLEGAGVRLELIEVPPSMDPPNKAPDLVDDMRSTGLNHVAFDVGPAIEAEGLDNMKDFLTALNRQSEEIFEMSVRLAVSPFEQRIGQDVFDLAFIMDADGVLIELLHHKLALETETPLAW